jgi:hypothetical protein
LNCRVKKIHFTIKYGVKKSLNKNKKYISPAKSEDMEGTCTHGGDKKCIQEFYPENLKRKDYLQDL